MRQITVCQGNSLLCKIERKRERCENWNLIDKKVACIVVFGVIANHLE